MRKPAVFQIGRMVGEAMTIKWVLTTTTSNVSRIRRPP